MNTDRNDMSFKKRKVHMKKKAPQQEAGDPN